MAFSYCPKCGFKNLYSIRPPNFCGGCGVQMSNASSVTRKNKPARVRKSVELENEDSNTEGTDIYSVPNIQSLAYEIEHEKISFDLKDVLPELEQEKTTTKKTTTKLKSRKRGRPKKS